MPSEVRVILPDSSRLHLFDVAAVNDSLVGNREPRRKTLRVALPLTSIVAMESPSLDVPRTIVAVALMIGVAVTAPVAVFCLTGGCAVP